MRIENKGGEVPGCLTRLSLLLLLFSFSAAAFLVSEISVLARIYPLSHRRPDRWESVCVCALRGHIVSSTPCAVCRYYGCTSSLPRPTGPRVYVTYLPSLRGPESGRAPCTPCRLPRHTHSARIGRHNPWRRRAEAEAPALLSARHLLLLLHPEPTRLRLQASPPPQMLHVRRTPAASLHRSQCRRTPRFVSSARYPTSPTH